METTISNKPKKKSPKYYWMKLKKEFFDNPEIKKLRRLAGGDTYVIIYLRIMLLVLNSGGIYEFKNLEDDVIKELALTLDEEEKNIQVVFAYLCNRGLIITNYKNNSNLYLLSDVVNNIGKETQDAVRKREKKIEEIENKENSGKIPEKFQQFPSESGSFPIEIEQEQEQESHKETDKELEQVEVTVDNIYQYLNDEQSNALNILIRMVGVNEIHSSKNDLLKYFVKLYLRGWTDSKGKHINDLVKYVSTNFKYKSANDAIGGI